MGSEDPEVDRTAPRPHRAGHVQPPGEHPEHRREHERLELLREAAIQAEYATGRQEPDEETARRHVLIRVGTIVVGFVVLLAGLAMLVLPGQGILTVIAGLAILSRELPWAERMLEYAKKKAKLDELKEQPVWVKGVAWAFTLVAIGAGIWWMFLADPKPGLADIVPGWG
ncbi:MAG: PGPGW domain-containing protein [Acidimicrobiales bacterium]|nr:PGPGW domain-containing protein [Acidimicrobiales bacterium]